MNALIDSGMPMSIIKEAANLSVEDYRKLLLKILKIAQENNNTDQDLNMCIAIVSGDIDGFKVALANGANVNINHDFLKKYNEKILEVDPRGTSILVTYNFIHNYNKYEEKLSESDFSYLVLSLLKMAQKDNITDNDLNLFIASLENNVEEKERLLSMGVNEKINEHELVFKYWDKIASINRKALILYILNYDGE